MAIIVELNPVASFKEKNGVYVFYVNFNYFFFEEKAAELMFQLFEIITENGDSISLPCDFINYLLDKEIIREVNNV